MGFVHPGTLHAIAPTTRMQGLVNGDASPVVDCYRLLQQNSLASVSYIAQGPFTTIARSNLGMILYPTKVKSEEDHKATYLNALMWNVTRNETYAQESIKILSAYAGTLHETGMSDNDAPLCVALQGFLLANAAELIEHAYPSASDTDIRS